LVLCEAATAKKAAALAVSKKLDAAPREVNDVAVNPMHQPVVAEESHRLPAPGPETRAMRVDVEEGADSSDSDDGSISDGCDSDFEDDVWESGHVSDRGRMICGMDGFYLVDSKVYREVGGDLVPYDAETKQYTGAVLPKPYRIVHRGSKLRAASGALGVYWSDGIEDIVAMPPFRKVKDFVISAKAHAWFKETRLALVRWGNTMTLGHCFHEHPYLGKTKMKSDIIVALVILSFLEGSKISSGVTPENVLLLTKLVFSTFPMYPMDLLVNTLLFFTYQRAALYSENMATTVALSDAMRGGVRFSAYREPETTNVVTDMLVSGIEGLTEEGAYIVNTEEHVKMMLSKGYTSITRLGYVDSSTSHGTTANRTKEPGLKFEMIKRKGYNEGAIFEDPYVHFKTNHDALREKICYESVGTCLATSAKTIDHKSTGEVEKCLLRLSMCRPDEEQLRANQISLVGPALEMGRRFVPGVDADLTAAIQVQDRKYSEDVHISVAPAEYTSNQRVVLESHLMYLRQEMDPILQARIVAQPLLAIQEYIGLIGGPKMMKRYAELLRFRSDINAKRKPFNDVKFKPDEAQKYKNGVLKFGRATISIVGSEWIHANPAMMYGMKHLIETVFTVTRVKPDTVLWADGIKSIFEMGGLISYSTEEFDNDLWYRAALSETDLGGLANLHQEMLNWCKLGPNRLAAVGHGDDIDIVKSDRYGEISAEEADISDNDGSYTDSLLRLEMQQVAVHCDPVSAYAQLANPLMLANPANENEKLLVRSTRGMLRCSGGIGTTYGNTKGGFLPILLYAKNSSRQTITEAAFDAGFNVTTDQFRIEQSTFLSKYRYAIPAESRLNPNEFGVMTCLASMLRSFGRITGDLPGSSKVNVADRWKVHVRGVVRSYVNEPDSMIMRALRDKYDGDIYSRIRVKLGYIPEMTYVDNGIIAHYYPEEEWERGVEEYRAFVVLVRESAAFGSVIAARFVDRIMKKRYGMMPVCR